ncbi:MAG: flavin reductase family protein [Synergistaceae bacterium]|nr:flavin reductase family protein [Synergistaceae bacterium]
MDKTIDMKALFSLTYGMYIVSTVCDGRLNGQIANTVMQITSEPLCVATCLNKANLTTELIKKSGCFSVSILEQDVPMTFIGQFGFKSGRDIDKFSNVKFEPASTGAPLIEDWSIAAFDARVCDVVDMPSHVLFIGEVQCAKFFKEALPLTYSDYHSIKKGKSPKTAPTFGFNTLK